MGTRSLGLRSWSFDVTGRRSVVVVVVVVFESLARCQRNSQLVMQNRTYLASCRLAYLRDIQATHQAYIEWLEEYEKESSSAPSSFRGRLSVFSSAIQFSRNRHRGLGRDPSRDPPSELANESGS